MFELKCLIGLGNIIPNCLLEIANDFIQSAAMNPVEIFNILLNI